MCAYFAIAVLRLAQFLKIYISQGSVATRFRCNEIFNDSFTRKLSVECVNKRVLKIDQYLAKIWTNVWQHVL